MQCYQYGWSWFCITYVTEKLPNSAFWEFFFQQFPWMSMPLDPLAWTCWVYSTQKVHLLLQKNLLRQKSGYRLQPCTVSITVRRMLCSPCYIAVWIKNGLKNKKVTMVPCAPVIIIWNTEISITLLCQLYWTRYTEVRIKKCLKSTSVINVYRETWMISRYAEEVITCNHQINTFFKMNGTQRRILVSH